MNREEIWAAIEVERHGLADLLQGLTPGDWERPSLCDGWRVRDVAAHLALAPVVSVGAGIAALVRARGNLNRMIHDTAVRHAAKLTSDEIVELIRQSATSRRMAPGTKPLDPLFDALVHGQDIAVPLGIERVMPHHLAITAATYIWDRGLPSYSPKRRLHGLRFVATDVDWSIGEGEVVEGPIQTLLLVLSGRPAGLPGLSGAGAAALSDRMPVTGRT